MYVQRVSTCLSINKSTGSFGTNISWAIVLSQINELLQCALSQTESGLRPLSHTREHWNETTGKSYHNHRLNRLEKKLIQVDTEKVIQKVQQQLTYSGHADREPLDISPQLQLNLQSKPRGTTWWQCVVMCLCVGKAERVWLKVALVTLYFLTVRMDMGPI